jgi:hypothetical protein
MFKLNHTPYTYKQVAKIVIASLSTNIMFWASYMFVEPQNGPTPHEHTSRAYLTRFSCCFGWNITHICPFTHTHRRELPSHLNQLAICTTWFCSLGVNPVGISLTCKYAMIDASSIMCRALLPYNSMFASSKSPSFKFHTSIKYIPKIPQ